MEKKRLIIISLFIIIFMVLIILSSLYYNGKYQVCFETGTDEIIISQYIKRNDKIKEPIDPSKEGYVFIEWQLDGRSYDFESKVNKDIVLTAKWLKEEYVIINFNTNSEHKIESKRILKGNIINELPKAIKEDYEFIGWYLNDKLYNNEQIYDEITLNAEYKNNIINTTYKIGDKVKIIGKYAKSSKSLHAYNKRAIGWEREIVNIINDSEFPYVIGDETGVTGFFKASSIEKIS